MNPKKKRQVVRCHGVLCPDRLYTVEGTLRAAGIGHKQLAEARKSGMVRPLYIGRRVYYQGGELIDWIKQTADSKPQNGRG